jgi:hypothetical protein
MGALVMLDPWETLADLGQVATEPAETALTFTAHWWQVASWSPKMSLSHSRDLRLCYLTWLLRLEYPRTSLLGLQMAALSSQGLLCV